MIWKEKYKIGVPLIDQQHKELFHRVEDFVVILRSDGAWEEKLAKVKSTMEFMKDYVVVHFHDEEEYQKKVDYPGREMHKKIHTDFAAEVLEFARKFSDEGYDEDLVQKFAGKLLAWLINHVAAEDQRIGRWVESLGGEQA